MIVVLQPWTERPNFLFAHLVYATGLCLLKEERGPCTVKNGAKRSTHTAFRLSNCCFKAPVSASPAPELEYLLAICASNSAALTIIPSP